MSIIDKVLVGHFVLQAVWMIIFLIWQFVDIGIEETTWQRIIRFFDVLEIIVFIVTRFLPFGKWGAYALCGFYIMNIIVLALQFTLANFGTVQKIKDIAWIIYYVLLIMIDIGHIDVVGLLVQRLVQSDIFLRDSWIGDVIKTVIVIFAKRVANAKIKD